MGNTFGTSSSSTSSPSKSDSSNMTAIQQFIESENKNHQVVVWSKSYCPYCVSANRLFQSMPGIDLKIHQLDQRGDGSQIQATLQKMTRQSTVPNIFVNNRHVGGNSDVQAAFKNGSLQKLLNQK